MLHDEGSLLLNTHTHTYTNTSSRGLSLISSKTEFDRDAVAGAVRSLWDAALRSGADVEAQVRASEVLGHALRHYRRDRALAARLELPWRPLYEAARAQCGDEGLPEMKGERLLCSDGRGGGVARALGPVCVCLRLCAVVGRSTSLCLCLSLCVRAVSNTGSQRRY